MITSITDSSKVLLDVGNSILLNRNLVDRILYRSKGGGLRGNDGAWKGSGEGTSDGGVRTLLWLDYSQRT